MDRAMAEFMETGAIGTAGGGSLAGDRRLELIGNTETVERARRYNVQREGGQ